MPGTGCLHGGQVSDGNGRRRPRGASARDACAGVINRPESPGHVKKKRECLTQFSPASW
ncbi:Hypothetical protein CAP_5661 [Chondromyces apiculatus DSM 436]|uniref:Uncharacterized protein n=1 Tax=Chondromyces apiculatus DSM 436 TaxID=1192034 RepID=A0A017T3A1_9BACT|nr:Hypothetical protein CAP_5661 [Chondromyces apiculatus DSM 436]